MAEPNEHIPGFGELGVKGGKKPRKDKGTKRAGVGEAITVTFDGDAMKWLREQARLNEREIEGQVRWCVRQAMKTPGPYAAA
jgi:hypothetical protein